MLFINPYRVYNNQWNDEVKQGQLQKEFHDMNCDKVLGSTNSTANQTTR
jgi:hypothetical protein